LREARARGADDVVLLNLAGEVAEASTSNIAFVRDGALVTPPLAAGILGGITRSAVLGQVAPALGVPAGEAVVRPEDLRGMGECLLLSTTKDIVPVASIDAQRFTVGPETVTARLKAAFAGFVLAYAGRRPDLRIL
jgi:branched-chain amino acid aminotransferase